MDTVAAVLALLAAGTAVLAAVGLLRFTSPFARMHAAAKASPVAYLIVALAASFALGWQGAGRLLVAGAALVVTLPIGVHLLFRALYDTTEGSFERPERS